MTQPIKSISPLRQRMIEDMTMRKLAPKTQVSYICAVKKLADFLGHSPHTASAEDLRKFQLHLTDIGTSRIYFPTLLRSAWVCSPRFPDTLLPCTTYEGSDS